MHRQIILDTETTGLSPDHGHRIIEIGAVEINNRTLTGKFFHYYLNPDRDINKSEIAPHEITNEFLKSKPRFSAIANELDIFLSDSEILCYN